MSQVGRFSEKHLHEAVGLNSFGREVGPFDAFNRGLRMHSERQSRDQLEFYEVSLQPAGPSEPSEEAIVSFLLSTFARRPPDLIVPIGGPASAFAHKYRQRLFFSAHICLGSRINIRRNVKALCHSSAQFGNLVRGPGALPWPWTTQDLLRQRRAHWRSSTP